MLKNLTTYCLVAFLFFTVATPTYFCLVEDNVEVSISSEFGDEEENQEEKSIEDSEVKTYYLTNNIYLFQFSNVTGITISKKEVHLEFTLNLDTPPPEFLT